MTREEIFFPFSSPEEEGIPRIRCNTRGKSQGRFCFSKPNFLFYLRDPISTIFFCSDFLAYEQLMFGVRFFTTFLCWFSPCSIWKLLFSAPTQGADVCAEFGENGLCFRIWAGGMVFETPFSPIKQEMSSVVMIRNDMQRCGLHLQVDGYPLSILMMIILLQFTRNEIIFAKEKHLLWGNFLEYYTTNLNTRTKYSRTSVVFRNLDKTKTFL